MSSGFRYKPSRLPEFPQCGHKQKAFQCAELTCQDIRKFHKNFFKCGTKIKQDCFILQYCNITVAKKSSTENSKRKVAIKYSILTGNGTKIPVCQKTFMRALTIKKDRIQGVMNRFLANSGEMPEEKRGGDRKKEKYEAKRISVEWFIESFKGQDSHYCRSKSANRIYLAPELSIRKMWRMYNAARDEDLRVKQSFFRHIFNTKYNIGFGNPRTDVCSTCIELSERIKTEKDASKKSELMVEKRLHRLRYKTFYKILQDENENIQTISFDCQKNQPIPKVPDQSAYYSRQINFYHFAIVVGNSKAKLDKNNIHSYYWDESSHSKGSNEIISAVYDFLKSFEFGDQIKILRVVSDGCAGQNKNTGMVAMLGKWLYTEAPSHLKKIELIFPVVGHSFIPPDRLFARIEKILKTKEVVVSPSDYAAVLEQHGSCKDLQSIPVLDWKESYGTIIKPTTAWHFQFMKSKRFFITRTKTENILVQGEETYRNETHEKKTITKKNKKITMISPKVIQPNNVLIKKSKIEDVKKLLKKHYGDEWRHIENLNFFNILEERMNNVQTSGVTMRMSDEISDLCEPGFDENTCHV